MSGERGQATIEWVGLVLLCAVVLGAVAAFVPVLDGRSLGALIAERIVCAVRGECLSSDPELVRAYGAEDAELLRRHAPSIAYERGERSIPIDYRRCRANACADAPDRADGVVSRSSAGLPATVFTRIVRRGGVTYLQYWFFYPDSNSTVLEADKVWGFVDDLTRGPRDSPTEYPGFHPDDWEGYQVRLAPGEAARVRATAHGGYRWCKAHECKNMWGPETGWTRVSYGSHAGHIPLERTGNPLTRLRHRLDGRAPADGEYRPVDPARDTHERTTRSEDLRLVPTERLHRRRYRPGDPGIRPPWRKAVYSDPEDTGS